MAIITELSRIENAADTIKDKVDSLGITVASPGKIDDYATAINGIVKRTPGDQTLNATTASVTISQGYYPSNTTVSVATSTISSVSLSSSEQTLPCANKLMTSNIVIPAANVYTTGSSAPTSSTPGNDGDLYLVTQ